MTEPHPDYRGAVRARCRADAIDRIADRLAQGLDDLPDVCLVIVERALANDLHGVRQFAGRRANTSVFNPTGVIPHD